MNDINLKKNKTSKKVIFLFFLVLIILIYQFLLKDFFAKELYKFNLATNAFWNVYNSSPNAQFDLEKRNSELSQNLLTCQSSYDQKEFGKCKISKICENYKCSEGNIIYVSDFNFPKEIKISLSQDSKAKIGDTIVYNENLIGRIRDVNSRTATITTIFDDSEKIPIKNIQNSSFGFVKFDSDSQLNLYPLSLDEGFKNDDIIVVAPSNSQNYLPNLILGKLKIVGDSKLIESDLDFRFIENLNVVER